MEENWAKFYKDIPNKEKQALLNALSSVDINKDDVLSEQLKKDEIISGVSLEDKMDSDENHEISSEIYKKLKQKIELINLQISERTEALNTILEELLKLQKYIEENPSYDESLIRKKIMKIKKDHENIIRTIKLLNEKRDRLMQLFGNENPDVN